MNTPKPTDAELYLIARASEIISECFASAEILIDNMLGVGYAVKNPRMLDNVTGLIYSEFKDSQDKLTVEITKPKGGMQ